MRLPSTSTQRKRRATLLGCLVAMLALLVPAAATAKITTIGSPLSTPATLNTAENLGYPGVNTDVPPSPEAPNGVAHTFHFGADTAIWNVSKPVPATGQAKKVELEGCAKQATNGPPPLTQIHFQDLSPQPGGGAKINITSQPFDIPVCGVGGASGSTVSTYEPINLCVSAGDYVDFNDEGGFNGQFYRSGVGYQVLGSARGSTLDSFISGGGTNNGALLSPAVTSAMEGFSASEGQELMLRVTLATESDATHICPGGKGGLPPALAPIRVSPQTDGVNHSRIVAVAMFCRVTPCKGIATLTLNHKAYGRSGFELVPNRTVHLPIRVNSELVQMIRRQNGVSATLDAEVNGETTTQTVVVKIF
jgi:hypothetical protein